MQTEAPSTPARASTDTDTASPPSAEGLRFALRVAGDVARQLHEAGREIRFAVVPTPQRVSVLLCDVEGRVLSPLTPSRALEIATGEPVSGGSRGLAGRPRNGRARKQHEDAGPPPAS
jgi:hypothetical protein